MKSEKIKELTMLGMLTAIVVLLQLVVRIRFGVFSLSTVLVPIVIGAALYGVGAGAWLGLVFGAVVLLSGEAAFFLGLNAPGTIVLVIVKGVACGAAAGVVYKILKKKNDKVAAVAASIVCPVVNTGVFLVLSMVFFNYDLRYVLTAFIGVNFFIELAVNALLSSTIIFLIKKAKTTH
ncbi:MAG: ECF transporter S component [Lachnospiraceae bacterium]|nr:ECF transporter S component [Lachnospiraceae bacterium]